MKTDQTKETKRVLVIGGGPAGMLAAIYAARGGAAVTILEKMEQPGKKLLLTGNGKCNLTHKDEHPEQSLFSETPGFAGQVVRSFSWQDTCQFFREIGLLTLDRRDCIYPVTGQAGTVLSVLLRELGRLRVKMKYSEQVEVLEQEKGIWRAKTSGWTYEAEAVILACGSKAAPRTGSDGNGYELARQLGHRIRPVFPALAAVECREKAFAAAAGVRMQAAITLLRREEKNYASLREKTSSLTLREKRVRAGRNWACLRKETGELQWTAYGISGILVFQISRFLSSCEHPENTFCLELDLLPEYEEAELKAYLSGQYDRFPQSSGSLSQLLRGILPEKLIAPFLQQTGVFAQGRKPEKQMRTGTLSAEALQDRKTDPAADLAWYLKHLRLTPTGVKGFDSCQVCRGGVDLSQLDPATMGSRLHPGLYFAGEICDVDGLCGGYNLQWAWASGALAGKSAAASHS